MDIFEIISKGHQKCLEFNLLSSIDKSYLEKLRDDLEYDYGKGARLRKRVLLNELAQRLDLKRFDQDNLRKLAKDTNNVATAILYLAAATLYLMDNFQVIEERGVPVKRQR